MESSSLKIRRWVATVVVIAAFAGGALLSQGFRNWADHTVFGSSAPADHRGAECAAGQSWEISRTDFRRCMKPALPGGG